MDPNADPVKAARDLLHRLRQPAPPNHAERLFRIADRMRQFEADTTPTNAPEDTLFDLTAQALDDDNLNPPDQTITPAGQSTAQPNQSAAQPIQSVTTAGPSTQPAPANTVHFTVDSFSMNQVRLLRPTWTDGDPLDEKYWPRSKLAGDQEKHLDDWWKAYGTGKKDRPRHRKTWLGEEKAKCLALVTVNRGADQAHIDGFDRIVEVLPINDNSKTGVDAFDYFDAPSK
ncbi:hypothetical protein PRZ48_012818 [Zasmidium cellare]|uniref:Uncharacterized protein n=1 Tax=Zasmidium cellare TaxID=395010 RepID=A0ABR0E5X5_ZASCE|nr:hypothetical protein PRZ48_012818 [Zasmidium cellare]